MVDNSQLNNPDHLVGLDLRASAKQGRPTGNVQGEEQVGGNLPHAENIPASEPTPLDTVQKVVESPVLTVVEPDVEVQESNAHTVPVEPVSPELPAIEPPPVIPNTEVQTPLVGVEKVNQVEPAVEMPIESAPLPPVVNAEVKVEDMEHKAEPIGAGGPKIPTDQKAPHPPLTLGEKEAFISETSFANGEKRSVVEQPPEEPQPIVQ
jgi:hypothetical protein